MGNLKISEIKHFENAGIDVHRTIMKIGLNFSWKSWICDRYLPEKKLKWKFVKMGSLSSTKTLNGFWIFESLKHRNFGTKKPRKHTNKQKQKPKRFKKPRNQETKQPTNQDTYPLPLNIPTPTPAPAPLLGDTRKLGEHEGGEGYNLHFHEKELSTKNVK